MKTTNNVQKAILKSLTVGMSLVLISITINAQDFWKSVLENNSLNEIALAMVGTSENETASKKLGTSDVEFFAAYIEEETEKPMELEPWMTNDFSAGSYFFLQEETEAPLNLKGWMTSDNHFYAPAFTVETAVEESLELEDWMINSKAFKSRNEQKTEQIDSAIFEVLEEEMEEELKVERWMMSEKTWKI